MSALGAARLRRAVAAAALLAAYAPATACRRHASEAEGTAGADCAADSVRTLGRSATIPGCKDDLICRARCRLGDVGACLATAYALDKEASSLTDAKALEARSLYGRACRLGAANGCTNYAASIWAGTHTDEQFACVQRTFDKACAAKESFACGMAGRLLIEDTDPPAVAEARQRLQASCDELGGFPCRVLAKHFESGSLGDHPPGLIASLLERACQGGDPDGCGEPATAAETFH